jgi:hypothetical protein
MGRVRLGWFVDQSRTALSFSAYAEHRQVQLPGAYNRQPPDFKDEAGGSDEPMSRLKVEVYANSEFRDLAQPAKWRYNFSNSPHGQWSNIKLTGARPPASDCEQRREPGVQSALVG